MGVRYGIRQTPSSSPKRRESLKTLSLGCRSRGRVVMGSSSSSKKSALFAQCVQIFKPRKAQKIVKKREKKRQPKMSKKLLHFWTFQGWLTLDTFWIIFNFVKNFNFYYIKIAGSQKAPVFTGFALCAICKNQGAREGRKAPLLRQIARSGHTGSYLGAVLRGPTPRQRSLCVHCPGLSQASCRNMSSAHWRLAWCTDNKWWCIQAMQKITERSRETSVAEAGHGLKGQSVVK